MHNYSSTTERFTAKGRPDKQMNNQTRNVCFRGHRGIENRELPWCQVCWHWWDRRLSSWQPTGPPVTTKLAPWRQSFSVRVSSLYLCEKTNPLIEKRPKVFRPLDISWTFIVCYILWCDNCQLWNGSCDNMIIIEPAWLFQIACECLYQDIRSHHDGVSRLQHKKRAQHLITIPSLLILLFWYHTCTCAQCNKHLFRG